jgi:hypothetical protein
MLLFNEFGTEIQKTQYKFHYIWLSVSQHVGNGDEIKSSFSFSSFSSSSSSSIYVAPTWSTGHP